MAPLDLDPIRQQLQAPPADAEARWAWAAETITALTTEVDRLSDLAVEELLEHDRRVARLAWRSAQRSGDIIREVWWRRAQLDQVRAILARSDAEWSQWQTGLQSASRHEFLIGVLGEIAAVVFGDDDAPAEAADDAGLPVGLCGNRADHEPHRHSSRSLGLFWCSADQEQRLPYAAEKRQRSRKESDHGGA